MIIITILIKEHEENLVLKCDQVRSKHRTTLELFSSVVLGDAINKALDEMIKKAVKDKEVSVEWA
jgi:hypothetical protein